MMKEGYGSFSNGALESKWDKTERLKRLFKTTLEKVELALFRTMRANPHKSSQSAL